VTVAAAPEPQQQPEPCTQPVWQPRLKPLVLIPAGMVRVIDLACPHIAAGLGCCLGAAAAPPAGRVGC
jgi:hypothetical protein